MENRTGNRYRKAGISWGSRALSLPAMQCPRELTGNPVDCMRGVHTPSDLRRGWLIYTAQFLIIIRLVVYFGFGLFFGKTGFYRVSGRGLGFLGGARVSPGIFSTCKEVF